MTKILTHTRKLTFIGIVIIILSIIVGLTAIASNAVDPAQVRLVTALFVGIGLILTFFQTVPQIAALVLPKKPIYDAQIEKLLHQLGETLQLSKTEVERVATGWNQNKVANIYWLGSDLMHAALITQVGGQPNDIIRDLDHILWHSEQLKLDPVVTGRLAKLLEQSKRYSEWDMPNRVHIAQELSALISIVGFIVEAADPEFKPQRPDLPPITGDLLIIEGKWGSDAGTKDGWVNVTDVLKAQAEQNRLKIVASVGNLGEPNYGVRKILRVKYSYNGVIYDREIKEDETLDLP